MEFINNGNPVKIRIGGIRDCHWATINKGESVDLPARAGISYGFSVKTTEGQIGNKKVETKQIEAPSVLKEFEEEHDFFKELQSINGIGKKTAQDIIKYAPTKEILIDKIKTKDGLPFRDDVEQLLRSNYD